MRIRNALKIAIANSTLVFKNLLYKIVIIALFGIAIGLILDLSFSPLYSAFSPIVKSAKQTFLAIIQGQEVPEGLIEACRDFAKYFSEHTGSMILTVILSVALIFAYNFFSGISDCTLMILVKEHMTSCSHRNFLNVLFENLGRILLFQLIETLLSVVAFFIAGVLSYTVFKLTVSVVPVLCKTFSLAVGLLIIALYYTFMSRIMSIAFDENKKITDCFADAFKVAPNYFWRTYASYLTVILIFVYLFATALVFTIGIGDILLIPFASLLLVCLRQVDYFTVKKQKYYIDFDTIIVPKELRENDENLLNDIEI